MLVRELKLRPNKKIDSSLEFIESYYSDSNLNELRKRDTDYIRLHFVTCLTEEGEFDRYDFSFNGEEGHYTPEEKHYHIKLEVYFSRNETIGFSIHEIDGKSYKEFDSEVIKSIHDAVETRFPDLDFF
ncbi:MAG: hypothetical protein MOGMAGMI_00321 [Candidatus Omnitrophica bacterium]|nr:hypothetical protein [Candidatus Omnitrophota bacterium]